MRSTTTRSALLVSALSVAALALPAGTADAARKSSAQRDAVMEQCIAKAQAETPFFTQYQGGYRRADLYKSCMVQAGMRP